MNQCQWRRKIPSLIALVLAVPLCFLMMPLGMESLYAQPTLTEMMDTPEGDQTKSKKISQKKGIPEDVLNRGVPRSSVREFLT